MYNMMNTTDGGSGIVPFWGVHILSIIVFGVGVALLLFWAFKHLSESALWKWGWTFAVTGTILCLLTLPAWPSFGMMGNFNGGFGRTGYGMMPMMWGGNWQGVSDAATAKDEADGKAIFDRLQAKQTTCADLSADDFDLLGDYFMGQRMGNAHPQMNVMMQQMMGDEGEKQMHIIMGRNLSGCASGSPTSGQLPQGMMNGGGMMRRFTSSSAQAQ